jgi:SAM-dependent methyltransferase
MRLIKYFKTIRLLYRSLSHTVDLPEINSLDAFLESMKDRPANQGASQSLDLGCGKTPRNPFLAQTVFGVDIRPDAERHILQADLTQAAIPFDDSSMDFITAFDFIEHVPRVVYLPAIRYPFIELMNEIHRVLKPNGLFLSQTPIFPFSACFTDPTHVNPITSETFHSILMTPDTGGKCMAFMAHFRSNTRRFLALICYRCYKKWVAKGLCLE